MKLHRVYYKELSRTDKISIDNKSKINHLRNVLRLSEGSKLDVFDGEGNSSICKIVSLEKKKIMYLHVKSADFMYSKSQYIFHSYFKTVENKMP